MPRDDATLVAKLKAAGAIILGKTNVTELNGLFDANMPEGYSSLGGQVLLPSDTDKTPAGSSAGSAAATASGLAAMTVGLETSTDTAQMIAPAGVAGVVALKPTVGRVSRDGRAAGGQVAGLAGPDHADGLRRGRALQAIAGRSRRRDCGRRLPTTLGPLADRAERQARRGDRQHHGAVPGRGHARSRALGATTVVKTVGTPSPNPPSIVAREFKRDLNAYLRRRVRRRQVAAGDHRLQRRQPGRGPQVPAGRADRAQASTCRTRHGAYEADKAAGKASNRR